MEPNQLDHVRFLRNLTKSLLYLVKKELTAVDYEDEHFFNHVHTAQEWLNQAIQLTETSNFLYELLQEKKQKPKDYWRS